MSLHLHLNKMNKKADNILIENVIFLIVIVLFFVSMFTFVLRTGSQVTIKEQIYAKQIALIIDKVKVGTNISLDISELYAMAEKNRFTGEIINISDENNKVKVNLVSGKGYEFEFFNNAEIKWGLDKDKKTLLMEVVKNG
jgi:hypothetical protein